MVPVAHLIVRVPLQIASAVPTVANTDPIATISASPAAPVQPGASIEATTVASPLSSVLVLMNVGVLNGVPVRSEKYAGLLAINVISTSARRCASSFSPSFTLKVRKDGKTWAFDVFVKVKEPSPGPVTTAPSGAPSSPQAVNNKDAKMSTAIFLMSDSYAAT